MYDHDRLVLALAAGLRTARQARKLSIAELASQVDVSPRLVSEFERGKRPHVSLDTAVRLLDFVGVSLAVRGESDALNADAARAARAEHRRQTWSGVKTTLPELEAPVAASSYVERLSAVARASQLAVGLQTARRKASTRQPASRRTT